jgi:uncharacterized SAM-binding protein YcdF (DUF218 family)
MQEVVSFLGLEPLKPYLTALLLPPVPLLLLALLGARVILRRRGLGWLLLLMAVTLLYLSTVRASAVVLHDQALRPPPPISAERIAQIKAEARGGPSTAIVVLGGGRRSFAPEYSVADLNPTSFERLRYGMWLARQTGAPMAFTGGVGWAAIDRSNIGATEAEIAARIAKTEFDLPLRWVEGASRDTRENAILTIKPLREAGVRRVVLVTDSWHMPRALREFQQQAGADITVEPAAMGYVRLQGTLAEDWLPSGGGMLDTRSVLRELLARVGGG